MPLPWKEVIFSRLVPDRTPTVAWSRTWAPLSTYCTWGLPRHTFTPALPAHSTKATVSKFLLGTVDNASTVWEPDSHPFNYWLSSWCEPTSDKKQLREICYGRLYFGFWFEYMVLHCEPGKAGFMVAGVGAGTSQISVGQDTESGLQRWLSG